jgi:hypothetical protein
MNGVHRVIDKEALTKERVLEEDEKKNKNGNQNVERGGKQEAKTIFCQNYSPFPSEILLGDYFNFEIKPHATYFSRQD